LDENESIVYCNLLRLGPAKIGTIKLKVDLERNLLYRTLLKLRNKGMIITTTTNPPYYSPVNPNEAIHNILLQKEVDITIKNTLSDKIINILNEFKTTSKNSEEPFLNIIQGRKNSIARIVSILRKSKNAVSIIMNSDDLSKLYYSPIPEEIEKRVDYGIEIRIITDAIDQETLKIIEKFNPSEIRTTLMPSQNLLILEKNKNLILSETNNFMPSKSKEDSIIHTNSHALLSITNYYFEKLWEISKPVMPVIKEKII